MNTNKNTTNDNPFGGSSLDEMLREWHDQNTEAARDSLDALAARLTRESEGSAPIASIGVSSSEKDALTFRSAKPKRRFINWALPMAAVLALVGAVAIWFGPSLSNQSSERVASRLTLNDQAPATSAAKIITLPYIEGLVADSRSAIPHTVLNAAYTPIAGRLNAINDEGDELGACPLEHTEVDVNIAGRFARVSLTQHYYNTFPDKIEAVYTFPMSQDSAVDAMKITVGDRVIEAEIEERDRARQIYEAARSRGHVAALLEQERPNIFTQSVANIEPGERVSVHISYIELVSASEGERSFDFPMVVAPRYIPGPPTNAQPPMPGEESPKAATPGAPFAKPTGQVPDAERITSMPNHPNVRAGHDISISVTINTGGPALLGIESGSHEINITNDTHGFNEPRTRAELSLASFAEIPNKDFVLTWRQEAGFIEPSVFTHTNDLGSFATLVLEPPARVDDAVAMPKELVFVLDTSGSMNGLPIEKAKQVITESLQSLRPQDSFNIITFAGSTRILWEAPMPGSPANIRTAQEFVAGQHGAGGTEMMHAVNKALIQADDAFKHALSVEELASTPADGRRVIVRVAFGSPRETDPATGFVTVHLPNGRTIETSEWIWQDNPQIFCPTGVPVFLSGRWVIEESRRILRIEAARYAEPARPLRIVAFLTDGQVGNDQAIIAAVKRNAATTRVFSFGIGSSPNHYLLDSLAKASKGEVEYVGLDDDASEKASRFAERIATPVLRDVTLTIPASLAGAELSSPDLIDGPRLVRTNANGDKVYALPDLFDVKPITIHARLDTPASGTPLFRGFSPLGEYRSGLDVSFAQDPNEPQLPILWARAEVEHTMNRDLLAAQRGNFPAALRERVVELGKAYSIMTQFTSFVAVDRARVTIGGQPRLVRVPLEMPEGMNYWKIFSRLPRPTQEWLQPSMSQMAHADPQTRDLGRAVVDEVDDASLVESDIAVVGGVVRKLESQMDVGSWSALTPAAVSARGDSNQITNYSRGRTTDASGLRPQLGDIPALGSFFTDADQEKKESRADGLEGVSSMLHAPAENNAGDTEESNELSEDLFPSRERIRIYVTKLDLELLTALASGEWAAPIRVSILLSDVSDESLRALVEAGATLEGTSKDASLIIASISPEHLEALLMLDHVLRIEPASIKKDG